MSVRAKSLANFHGKKYVCSLGLSTGRKLFFMKTEGRIYMANNYAGMVGQIWFSKPTLDHLDENTSDF